MRCAVRALRAQRGFKEQAGDAPVGAVIPQAALSARSLHGPGGGLGTGPGSSRPSARRGGNAPRHQEEPPLLERDFQMLPWGRGGCFT